MLLSNSAKSFLICGFVLLGICACNWWQGSGPGTGGDPAARDRIPFSTAEPETFQCDVVRSEGDHEQRTFYARKGISSRYDISSSETVLQTDKGYRLNNEKRIYAELPAGDPSAVEPDFLADMTFSALKQNRNARFEALGNDSGFSKYDVTLEGSDNAKASIYVDEKNGLVMKEEFFSTRGQADESAKPIFVFELRNVKMDVDDSVFTIPAGYKKLAWNDYLAAIKPRKNE
jgi:hypothetical protein